MDLVADLNVANALLTRANALDPSWNRGAVHEVLIALEAARFAGARDGRPVLLPGRRFPERVLGLPGPALPAGRHRLGNQRIFLAHGRMIRRPVGHDKIRADRHLEVRA